MDRRSIGEQFNIVVSTKKTLLGASASDFKVSYASVDTLESANNVVGGAVEVMQNIVSGSEHTATTNTIAVVGSKVLMVDTASSTIEVGDAIEYATDTFAYVQSIVGGKIYLRVALQAQVSVGATLTQVGNMGQYVTEYFSIADEGEYIISVEAPKFGIFTEKRVVVLDGTAVNTVDADAPTETIAVSY